MGFLAVLQRIFAPRPQEDPDESIEVGHGQTIRYVNFLLSKLRSMEGKTITLRKEDGLPVYSEDVPRMMEEDETLCYQTVVNRLKVMAELNPIRCPVEQTGRFDILVSDKDHLAFSILVAPRDEAITVTLVSTGTAETFWKLSGSRGQR